MEVAFDGQNAFAAAGNGDFPLVVLLWGMAIAVRPTPVDLLVATDADGNTVLHHASATALEGNTAIVHFLLQQAQAAGRDLATVVEARNAAGETPLLRAAHAGNLRVVDALVKFGRAETDVCDHDGNTPLHHAAYGGHLWVLHYLLENAKRNRAGSPPDARAMAPCNDENEALRYACSTGNKVAVQYLLSRGFDPHRASKDGKSALDVARERKCQWMVELLDSKDRTLSVSPVKIRQTRLHVALSYGLALAAVLSTSYFLPWWIALPFISIVIWRSLSKFRKPHKHAGHSHGGPAKDPTLLHPSKRNLVVSGNVSLTNLRATSPSTHDDDLTWKSRFPFLLLQPQPEMIMGVWMGWVFVFTGCHGVMWLDKTYEFIRRDGWEFLVALWVLEGVFILVWARLAVICPSDPGVVKSFKNDITGMLANAADGVPPPTDSHCRTCIVRKPIRSKHCAQCGVCVARMDHHCGWVNRCIGYGNHRLFVVFLLFHLVILGCFVVLTGAVFRHFVRPSNLKDTIESNAMRVWMQVPALVSDHLLIVLVFVWAAAAFVALASMLIQHLGNISNNITVNETINWKRYAYLRPSASPTKKRPYENAFDHGLTQNTSEFWCRSGESHVDYHTVFDGPRPETALQEEGLSHV